MTEVRCEHCEKLFDSAEAEAGPRIKPNTLSPLPDHSHPWIKCPHCGCTN
jgi:phage FluMu protein Com